MTRKGEERVSVNLSHPSPVALKYCISLLSCKVRIFSHEPITGFNKIYILLVLSPRLPPYQPNTNMYLYNIVQIRHENIFQIMFVGCQESVPFGTLSAMRCERRPTDWTSRHASAKAHSRFISRGFLDTQTMYGSLRSNGSRCPSQTQAFDPVLIGNPMLEMCGWLWSFNVPVPHSQTHSRMGRTGIARSCSLQLCKFEIRTHAPV